MEQFSLLPQMVEIVTVTHKLLISISPVLFQGCRLSHCRGSRWRRAPEVLWLARDEQQLSPAPERGVSAFRRGSVLPHQSQGGFYLATLI